MSTNCNNESNFNAKLVFTSEHKRFMTEVMGFSRENGDWTYMDVACLAGFRKNFQI
jgi:uncharacterized protein YchJ